MFLISKFVYEAMGESKLHATSAYLKIRNHSPEQHKQTFYKFRYGAPALGDGVGTPGSIRLRRGESKPVWSLEAFELSERVLGLFGHSSELFLRGIELVHSPFIDPGFQGQLRLTLRNVSDQEVALNTGDVIGKVVFFDISDTILSAEELLSEVQKNAQNQVRKAAIHELSRALGELSKE
jgi:dUTPase